ncbi:MAG: glycoside hydrolase family 97 catalytic domain-containing protein [Bacteroidales bacterium]|jgi:alpha-glucosidase|nr:glycoside hydrolase family 97 catalytic domain-containing protein [Bacteroidales bacterium]
MKKIILFLFSVILLLSCNGEKKMKLSSPNDKIQSTIKLSEAGSLSYTVSINVEGEQVTALESSKLGLDRSDASFSENLKLVNSEGPVLISDSYKLKAGKKRDISYEANESTYTFESASGEQIQLIFRVFNDGVAYRYYFPGEGSELLTITKEYSSFNLPDEGNCWSQAYDAVTKYTPAYETYYERKMTIGTAADPEKNGWSFPTTFETNNIWVLITESNLDGTYPASHLEADCKNGEYKIRFPEEDECFGEYSNKPQATLPWHTPWRAAIIGETPAAIIESTMVTDLADPCKLDDTSWIKPGIAAWSWWSDSDSPQLVKEQKSFIDLAVIMRWDYNLVDANWNNMKDGNVSEAISYGNRKGIGTLLWYNSGGAHNEVSEEPRDKMWDPEIRKAEFEKIAKWGAKGVKVDFFQSDKQEIIKQYLGILKDAAANNILVNFHGCTLPRGWNRTYPNMLTLEAARGAESYKFAPEYPENAPWHNTVLPFTRNAVGPMDFTPVCLSDVTYPHLTSFAHELALPVIFESGITHMADKVEMYLSMPEYAKDFLMNVPAVWDELKFIDGYPGEFIVLARRSGDTWYVAGLNGNNSETKLSLNTSFLEEGDYNFRMIADGAYRNAMNFGVATISTKQIIKIPAIAYGGFVGVISPE